VKGIDQNTQWIQKLIQLKATHPVHVVTSMPEDVKILLNKIPALRALSVLGCDGTAIKTAARAVPVLFKMEQDRVVKKWSGADADQWQ
jgi:hypothetical protein